MFAAGAPGSVARSEGALADAAGKVAALTGAVAGFGAANAVDAGEPRFARSRRGPARFADLQEAALAGSLAATLRANAAPVLRTELPFRATITGAAALHPSNIALTDGTGLTGGGFAAKAHGCLGVAADAGRAAVGAVGRLEHVANATEFDHAVAADIGSLALHTTRTVAAA